MKAIIFNTGHEADGLNTGEEKVVDLEVAEALALKWGGMMKVLPYEEPEVKPEPAKVAKKESVIKKTIKKLRK